MSIDLYCCEVVCVFCCCVCVGREEENYAGVKMRDVSVLDDLRALRGSA